MTMEGSHLLLVEAAIFSNSRTIVTLHSGGIGEFSCFDFQSSEYIHSYRQGHIMNMMLKEQAFSKHFVLQASYKYLKSTA